MAKVDIVHDAQGNVLGFSVHHPESASNKTGVEVRDGQSVTSLDVPGHPAEDSGGIHCRRPLHSAQSPPRLI